MNYKTTKKDFQIFKEECEYWIEYFGLKDWEWDIRHENPDEKCRAAYNLTFKARYTCVRLSREWNAAPRKYEVQTTAFHEVMHVMLSELSEMAMRSFNDNMIETQEHKIIQIMENTVFKEHRG